MALYYAPQADDPLWHLAADWLGRDPATGAPRPQPELPDIADVTADPRTYGFHATLKPPMRLVEGAAWTDVLDAAAEVAAGIPAFDLPGLSVQNLDGFLALRETTPSPELQALADACVIGLDALRAPPGEAELARRRRNGLRPAQEAMLARWGYPYVFATWFFHMTLTRRLTPAEHAVYRPEAEAFFATALTRPRRVDDISLFVQDQTGAPFTLAERIPLRG
ncbi:DUF1045 domain-containing protein [Limobrevibacterium gyesilva]|uniref:DUF1045 domain-containing protein n=1 Tax=Limobrevibacterium gyesilva TaxID=2991712 RepID=UPI002227EA2E